MGVETNDGENVCESCHINGAEKDDMGRKFPILWHEKNRGHSVDSAHERYAP